MDTCSVINFGNEGNIKSKLGEDDCNICLGSLITWCKPNCDEIFSIASPSIVVMSFLHQLLDFALNSPRSSTKKRLYCTADSKFSWRLSLKDSNWSCYRFGDLYNAMKLQSVLPTVSSKVHNF